MSFRGKRGALWAPVFVRPNPDHRVFPHSRATSHTATRGHWWSKISVNPERSGGKRAHDARRWRW
ncbi:hypothetical protein F383_00516 [Gossypium arboreum]|uniref:Uncharacterized protein n=1 Tax=Gossypium arboreum TaxID=29729 RepID=A0A0B0PTE3_GOSAR|nr:hypothetical protein F383_00516 [Gossypium arboreum]